MNIYTEHSTSTGSELSIQKIKSPKGHRNINIDICANCCSHAYIHIGYERERINMIRLNKLEIYQTVIAKQAYLNSGFKLAFPCSGQSTTEVKIYREFNSSNTTYFSTANWY